MGMFEAGVEKLKRNYGLFGKVKWEKVPAASQVKKLDGYKAILQTFLQNPELRFKCMVVDTHKYPLDNKKRWRGDSLIGYLKFYCTFLSDGLMCRIPGHFYNITMDNYSFREGHDSRDLRESVEGRYQNKAKQSRWHRHCELETAREEDSIFLQFTDLLTGAVAFCWNGGKERDSLRAASRKELVSILENHFKSSLNNPTPMASRFSIWEFKAQIEQKDKRLMVRRNATHD